MKDMKEFTCNCLRQPQMHVAFYPNAQTCRPVRIQSGIEHERLQHARSNQTVFVLTRESYKIVFAYKTLNSSNGTITASKRRRKKEPTQTHKTIDETASLISR